jgi:hypothetical protein
MSRIGDAWHVITDDPAAGRHTDTLPFFAVGDRTFTRDDVVLAAAMSGEWAVLAQQVTSGLACLARLDDLDDPEAQLSESDVDEAASEFRYARGLEAAADMEAWLDRQGLDVEGWLDCIRRSLLRTRWADDLAAIVAEYEVPADDVAAAMLCEAVCTGLVANVAARLAARAAAHAALATGGAGNDDGAEVKAVLDAVPADVVTGRLPGLPHSVSQDWLKHLARLEVSARRFARQRVTAEAVRAAIATHQLEWTRIAARYLLLPTEDAAAEAVLCLRDDGAAMTAVAAASGSESRESEWFLDDLQEPLRGAVVGAQAGDIVGPVPLAEAFVVIQVAARRAPAEEDPAARARAEREVLDAAIAREVAERVRWLTTP